MFICTISMLLFAQFDFLIFLLFCQLLLYHVFKLIFMLFLASFYVHICTINIYVIIRLIGISVLFCYFLLSISLLLFASYSCTSLYCEYLCYFSLNSNNYVILSLHFLNISVIFSIMYRVFK